MGFPKAQWLTSSSLPACRSAGHVTPQIFMLSVATTTASGGQSIAAELVDYGQQAFKRNVDAFNQALRVRSTTDLLNIQTGYFHDSLGAVLSTSARISEISAKTATEAASKLQQRKSA
jgi:hypothetical protein